MNILYIDSTGVADSTLPLYAGRHGDWQIDIQAVGTTRDMVDWQIVGYMHCQNMDSGHRRSIGLVWDESRILTDYDGVGDLTRDEFDALNTAGFNLYNFMEIRGLDDHIDTSNEYAENRAAEMAAMLEDTEEADKAGDFDAVGFIMDFEAGALDEDEVIDGFQHMLDTGLVWQLQGKYGREAAALLDAGLIERRW